MNGGKRWGIFVFCIVLLSMVLAGCGAKPTPIQWEPTVTPTGQATSQAAPANTSTPQPANPTATSDVTATTTPTPTETPIQQSINVVAPLPDALVSNPLHIAGNVAVMPFEGTLVVRIYDVNGAIAAELPITAQGELDGPGTFEAQVVYGGNPGPGRLEVLDISVKDGSTIAKAEVPLQLGGFPGAGIINLPQTQENVTLPIRMLARVGNPGQKLNISLVWDDGSQFMQSYEALPGMDGKGLVITILDMPGHISQHPPTQGAKISITSIDGSALALQPITVLAPGSNTMTTNVYWINGETVIPETIAIPRTVAIARASLNLLLWGPSPGNAMGYTSALPTPKEILTYPERTANWGEFIRINNLTIIDGVASVDFSPELLATSGGAAQVELIRQQIEGTLLQFSTVDSVVITVNGNPDALQP